MVAVYTSQASAGSNVLRLPQQTRVAAILPSVFPQGWAFFTKAADSAAISVYRVEGKIDVARTLPTASMFLTLVLTPFEVLFAGLATGLARRQCGGIRGASVFWPAITAIPFAYVAFSVVSAATKSCRCYRLLSLPLSLRPSAKRLVSTQNRS